MRRRRRRGNSNNRNEKEEEERRGGRGGGGRGEGKTIEFYYPKTYINEQCSIFFLVYMLLLTS